LDKSYNRILKKLFKEKLITFIATDTHSLRRPPMMADALLEIEKRFGIGEKQRIISNLETLYNNITVEAVNHEIEHTKYL
jgi:tyrosine-protein phosphatase YwqE